MTNTLVARPLMLRDELNAKKIEPATMEWRKRASPDEALVVDLAAVRSIDSISLMYLLATLAERLSDDEASTVLRLPENPEARDALRWSGFADALREVAGVEFVEIVAEADHHYFGEGDRGSRAHMPEDEVFDLISYLSYKRFFGMRAYPIGSTVQASQIIEYEWSRWRSPVVLQALDRHLLGPGGDIARIVIYELLANAIQHPGAQSATVVSGVESDSETGRDRLVIAVWDDGDAIVRTLRRSLERAGTIRVVPTRIKDEFRISAIGWAPQLMSMTSDLSPQPGAPDGELLVASVFPGTSQKGVESVEPIDPPEPDYRDAEYGFGLHALYRSVVDDFGGAVAIRSGRHSMRLAAAGPPRTYVTEVVEHRDWPDFLGNMVSIQVPIQFDS